MRPDRMVVLSNAKPGLEAEYHDWYNHVHSKDVFERSEGYSSLQRYELHKLQPRAPRFGYLALWELEPGRLGDALESISALRKIKQSGDFDPEDTYYRANPGILDVGSGFYKSVERIDNPIDSTDAVDDAVFTVYSNNQAGSDDEFDDWYSEHAHDVVFKLEGFKSAERFIVPPEVYEGPLAQYLATPEWRHLVIYRVDKNNVEAAQASNAQQRVERAEALAAGRRPMITLSDKMVEPHASWWWAPITGVIER